MTMTSSTNLLRILGALLPSLGPTYYAFLF